MENPAKPLIDLYERARKDVPVIKYGMGVAGLVAVCGTILSLKIDSFVLITAFPLLLCGMLFLVLFQKFVSSKSKSAIIMSSLFAWLLFLVSICVLILLISSSFFDWPTTISKLTRMPSSVSLSKYQKWLSKAPAWEIARDENTAASYSGETFTWIAAKYFRQPEMPAQRVKFVSDDIIIDAYFSDVEQLIQAMDLDTNQLILLQGTVQMPYNKMALRLVDCEIALIRENQQ